MSSPREARTRRSWPQRLLISFNALAVLAAAITAGVLAYGNRQLQGFDRFALSDELADEERAEGDPVNILVVGIDDASGLAEDDPARQRSASDLAGRHTDSIMLLRLDPGAGTIQTVSFPRDLWVTIADAGVEGRINSALPTGGQIRLIRTITAEFGIPIHHFMQVDFAGFGELIDIIGGVPVQFPHPVRSRARNDRGQVQAVTEIDIPTAGCWTLGPRQALAFSRERKGYQVQDLDGRWHVAPGGDFFRIERQQLLLRLAMEKAISEGARNPNTMRRLIELGAGIVGLDDRLTPGDLVTLGLQFRSFKPDEMQTYELPVSDGVVGEAQILHLREDAAEPILAVFRGATSIGSVMTGDTTVQVLNGTGVTGQGGDVTGQLARAGFETLVPEDAPERGGPTTIRYAEGNEAEAHLVALHVAGPVRYQVDPTLAELDLVVLITGSDWEGVSPTPKAVEDVEGPTTTTTTTTTAPGSPPGPASGGGIAPVDEEGDVNDPDDPAFYQPQAPPAGANCPSTI